MMKLLNIWDSWCCILIAWDRFIVKTAFFLFFRWLNTKIALWLCVIVLREVLLYSNLRIIRAISSKTSPIKAIPQQITILFGPIHGLNISFIVS